MDEKLIAKIKNDPAYNELISKRSPFSVMLSIIMLVVYFAFILTIAFEPSILGSKISEGGVITVGIPIGIAIIVFAFVLTGIYVQRANGEFDALNNKLKERVKGELNE